VTFTTIPQSSTVSPVTAPSYQTEAQPVPDTADFAPTQTRAPNLGRISETDGRFADYQQFALDCRDGFGIFAEGVEVHPRRKFLDQADSIRNIQK
jgi:hypothetical protein